MPHVCQVWFVKLLIEWYWVKWVFLEQGVFKVVRRENLGPTNGTRSEKVWEPLLYRNFSRWKQVKFFILSGNLLLREIQFYTVNCLKPFYFKLFFVYTVVLSTQLPILARLRTLFALYWQKYGSLQSLNVTLGTLVSFSTKQCKN